MKRMLKDKSNLSDEKKSFEFMPQDYKNLIIKLAAALIVGLITTVIYQGRKMSALEEKVNSLQEIIKQNNENASIPENKRKVLETAISDVPNPKEKLISFIKDYQSRYVKISTGTDAYNCFTNDDLKLFYENKTLEEIEQRLLQDEEFLALVLAIKELSPEKWADIKSDASKVYRTSAGGPRPDGSVQTTAGEQCERKVGETIVELVSKIRKKDKAEIVEMIN